MVAGGYPIGEGLSDCTGGIGGPVKAKDGGEAVDPGEETPSVR